MKAAGKASLSNTKAKSTKIGLKETERNKILVVDVRKVEFIYHPFQQEQLNGGQ